MPPLPMHPADPHRRWWMWGTHEIDLRGDDPPPAPIRAAVLAVRDAVTDEDHAAAAYLVWAIEEHPPWDGGCAACHTADRCPDQQTAVDVGFEFVMRHSSRLVTAARDRFQRDLSAPHQDRAAA